MHTPFVLLALAAVLPSTQGAELRPPVEEPVIEPIPLESEPIGVRRRARVWVVDVADLRFEDGPAPSRGSSWLRTALGPSLLPRVVIDGGSGVLGTPPIRGGTLQGSEVLAGTIALAGDDKPGGESGVTGMLFVPDAACRKLVAHPFSVPAEALRRDPAAHRAAMAGHYSALRSADLPGAAWWRAQAAANGAEDERGGRMSWTRRGRADVADTFAMFTGGRALAENLALDEVIRVGGEDVTPVIPLDEIEGVRVPEMVWDGLVAGMEPKLDALGAAVPHDQYGMFFPSFDALVSVADGMKAGAAPFVQLADGHALDAMVRERYEAQMLVSLDALTRAMGGRLVKSVAMTGSDPYLRTGSDLALLLEGDARPLLAFHQTKIEAAAAAEGVELYRFESAGHKLVGAVSVDRRVSSWVAASDTFVVISNSREQVERVLATADGRRPSLGSLPEMTWFRDRYPLGDAVEDALLVVSDPAIRRWAGPRWRVATARRTKVAAVLADAEAWRVAVELGAPHGPWKYTGASVPGIGGRMISDGAGVREGIHGALRFLTPIAELTFDTVTESEETGYERWRRGYERAWGASFDPLAVRITARDGNLDVDLTVMPLIVRTDYRWLIDLAGEARLGAGAGDPHDDAIVHWISAIDHDGPTYKDIRGLSSMIGISELGLNWLGDHAELWVDADAEYFAKAQETDSLDMFTDEMLAGFPVGFSVEVKNGLGVASFLASVRAFLNGVVPDMVDYQVREHAGKSYVAMVFTERSGFSETPTLYYAVLPGALTLSFNEGVIQRAAERSVARAEGETVGTDHWAGRSTAIHVGGSFRDAIAMEVIDLAVRDRLRGRSWANLAILNEWRRLGVEDALAFHETEWSQRLVCPGGGDYVWNAEDQTYESTAYGHPAAPKEGPALPPALSALESIDLGLDFETFAVDAPELREGERRRLVENSAQGLRVHVKLR